MENTEQLKKTEVPKDVQKLSNESMTPEAFSQILANSSDPEKRTAAIMKAFGGEGEKTKKAPGRPKGSQEGNVNAEVMKNKGEASEDSEESPVEKEEVKEPVIDWQKEYLKTLESDKKSKKWALDMQRKNVAYQKAIAQRKEDGFLDDEDANELLDHLKFEEESAPKEDNNLFYKMGVIWEREIENLRRYGNEPKINEYMAAFDHFAKYSSREEIEEVLADIVPFMEKDEVEFTKKTLEFGKKYYEEIFGEYAEAGNLRNFKQKFVEENAKKQKEIDKLQKELSKYKKQYADYDERPQMISPQGGNSDESAISSFGNNLGALFTAVNTGRVKLNR